MVHEKSSKLRPSKARLASDIINEHCRLAETDQLTNAKTPKETRIVLVTEFEDRAVLYKK